MSVAAFVVLSPLIAAALILVTRRWAASLALAGAVIALAAAVNTLARVAAGERFVATFPGLPRLPLHLIVDPLGALLATMVAVVVAAVFIYAVGYMEGDRDQIRFFAAMSCFVAAMQLLVLAGDWIVFLAAWELIALASYLLIGFWFEQPGVGAAATRAFATTRAADGGLYIGIFALAAAAGTTEIAATLAIDGTTATIAGLGFLLAAIGKSAQVPLQGWLQDAMVGPTPVSALLHSATLVVAGVVLLTRAFPLLSPEVRLAVGVVGGTTAVVTGVMAVAQGDLKRLLAASTSSQLGFMLLALGAGSVGAALVHLVTNAAIKSALFLGAGMFQHVRGSTALANLAGIGRQRRATFIGFAMASLALAGIPPLAGFWSKDAVLAATLDGPRPWLFGPLAVAGALLTGVYIGRALQLLWRSPGGWRAREREAAAPWMGMGFGGLALFAAGLGLAVGPIGRLLRVEVPEDAIALGLGLAAAVAGLLAGWRGLSFNGAMSGFRLRIGFDELVIRAVLAIAAASDRQDRLLHAGVLGVGGRALDTAIAARHVDAGIQTIVEAVGTASLAIAHVTRVGVEVAIDTLIASLVDAMWWLGARARRLQTGLIHRELLAAAAAGVVLILVLLF